MLSGPVSNEILHYTVPQACRGPAALACKRPGESRNSQRASFNSANAGQRFKWGSRPVAEILGKNGLVSIPGTSGKIPIGYAANARPQNSDWTAHSHPLKAER